MSDYTITPITAEQYGPVLSAEINALPERLKRYVFDLEQRADPAGDVRRAFVAEEKAMALEARVQELEQEIARLTRPPEDGRDAIRERHAEADAFLGVGCEPDAARVRQMHADLSVLLEDCRLWRNARDVWAAERIAMLEERDLHQARKDLVADLQQYRDWAEPQVQRLGQEVVARDAAEARERGLREALQSLIRAYVRLLENARDRIVMLGGQCDPVDRMERDDPNLRDARAALAAQPAAVEQCEHRASLPGMLPDHPCHYCDGTATVDGTGDGAAGE